MEKILTKSDKGEPLEVRISDDSIRAFRVDDAELEVYGQEEAGGPIKKKEKDKPTKELEGKLNKDPVMEVFKRGDNDFTVDFQAGIQRGKIHGETLDDLTDEVDVDMYHGPDIHSDKGWLEWIGLDPEMDELHGFLDREKLNDTLGR